MSAPVQAFRPRWSRSIVHCIETGRVGPLTRVRFARTWDGQGRTLVEQWCPPWRLRRGL